MTSECKDMLERPIDMKIALLTNEMCNCVDVEHALDALGFDYERVDIEVDSVLAERFNIRHCPTLIVDDCRVIPVDEHNVASLRQLLTEYLTNDDQLQPEQ